MQNLLTKVKNFFQEEEGASAVEYGLLVALIAVFIIAALGALGNSLTATFNAAANAIAGAGGG